MFVNPFHEPTRARNRVSDIGEWWWGWRGYDNSGRLCVEYLCDRTRKWLYDGWNIVRSVHDDGCATETSDYVWGADLSGTMDGAGGVGGLLAVRRGGVWHFPLYEANGNITAYISEAGAVSATYAYGSFGETVAHTGQDFLHRFGTKPYNGELGTYTYIYREYSPTLGRWLSEDPILEQGGFNLYSYCGNEPVGNFDFLGMVNLFQGCCNGNRYNKLSKCCRDGVTYDRFQKVETNVRICSMRGLDCNSVFHRWIEIGSKSIDFNTDGNVLFSAGQVNCPTKYAETQYTEIKECYNYKLFGCIYDVKKFENSVLRQMDNLNDKTFYYGIALRYPGVTCKYFGIPTINYVVPYRNCITFVNDIIEQALRESLSRR